MDMYRPPEPLPYGVVPAIFLAGSIEMGTASAWQEVVAKRLSHHDGALLNPRRTAWDSSWKQDITNPRFREQVTWELEGIERSDVIVVHFEPMTKSLITLLELGFAIGARKKIFLSCPDGFWRKGNIDIIALRNNIVVHSSLVALTRALQVHLTLYRKKSP